MVTKTVGSLHFTDLEPGRFEVLVYQIIYRMRRWERLDHFGLAGSDAGVDIKAVELLENGKRNIHHFQCKRYDKLTKSQLENIVKDYINKNDGYADYYYVVCGCNPSKKAIEGFDDECKKAGLKHSSIWSATYLESLLYSDYHDILFAFFGVNLIGEKNSSISSLRRNLALKQKMHNDFKKDMLSEEESYRIRYEGAYWLKFRYDEVLIRSIYDKKYPDNPLENPGYFKTEVYNWYHNGLEVRAYPYSVKAKVKYVREEANFCLENQNDYEVIECELEVFGCIPFENIIDYDMSGDEYYNYPHLYCDYPCGSDPYEEIRYRSKDGFLVSVDDIVDIK